MILSTVAANADLLPPLAAITATLRSAKSAAKAGAAVCPLAARAQQQVPVIGFLNIASPETWEVYVAGFKQGLAQTSFVEEVNG